MLNLQFLIHVPYSGFPRHSSCRNRVSNVPWRMLLTLPKASVRGAEQRQGRRSPAQGNSPHGPSEPASAVTGEGLTIPLVGSSFRGERFPLLLQKSCHPQGADSRIVGVCGQIAEPVAESLCDSEMAFPIEIGPIASPRCRGPFAWRIERGPTVCRARGLRVAERL